jgi:hypothetical protein
MFPNAMKLMNSMAGMKHGEYDRDNESRAFFLQAAASRHTSSCAIAVFDRTRPEPQAHMLWVPEGISSGDASSDVREMQAHHLLCTCTILTAAAGAS